jgi:hypothetical protein
MEKELISKKELLETTGISYGQLYRWKRKNLIPEEWFIKKASFTGQETFFPKEEILNRIDKITNMKGDLPLDDIAGVLSPRLIQIIISKEEVLKRNIVTDQSLEIYMEKYGESETLNFVQILFIFIVDKLLYLGEINREEGKILLEVLNKNSERLEGKNFDLLLIRKMGIFLGILSLSSNEIYFEPNVKLVSRMNLNSCIEELKIKLN